MRNQCGVLECGMQNAEMGNRHWQLATNNWQLVCTRTQDVKERGRRGGGPGKSGLPINGGAARPVHFSRSAAQREMGVHAVGV